MYGMCDTNRETRDSDILRRASREVRQAFVRFTHFSATWVFIASWHRVTYFGGSSSTSVSVGLYEAITIGSVQKDEELLSVVIDKYKYLKGKQSLFFQ